MLTIGKNEGTWQAVPSYENFYLKLRQLTIDKFSEIMNSCAQDSEESKANSVIDWMIEDYSCGEGIQIYYKGNLAEKGSIESKIGLMNDFKIAPFVRKFCESAIKSNDDFIETEKKK